jgi:hypothetical protein
VGAGSRDAAWYAPDAHDRAREHADELLSRGEAVVVQPLLRSVANEGEWPLLWFGGTFSHAASKRVALPEAARVEGLAAAERLATHSADARQFDVARQAVALVQERFGTPTYARVDLVRGDDGQPLVLEVELAEPSLFLRQGGPRAVERLVAALMS